MIHDFPPRLMPAHLAARYIGVSESKLASLGIRRRELGAKRLYDKADLDDYVSSLPYDGESEVNTCDSIFGIVSDGANR